MSKASLSVFLFLDSVKKESSLVIETEIDGKKKFRHIDNQFCGDIGEINELVSDALKPLEVKEFRDKKYKSKPRS